MTLSFFIPFSTPTFNIYKNLSKINKFYNIKPFLQGHLGFFNYLCHSIHGLIQKSSIKSFGFDFF